LLPPTSVKKKKRAVEIIVKSKHMQIILFRFKSLPHFL